MMKSAIFATLALIATASALAPLSVADEDVVEGRYIVVFKTDSAKADRDAHMSAIKSSAVEDATFAVTSEWDFFKFKAYAAAMSEETLNSVRADDSVVEFVEAEQIYRALKPVGDINANVVLNPEPKNATKSAAACQQQLEATWGLVRTAERDLRIDGIYNYDDQDIGAGVDAYIIDTGIMISHVEFEGRAVWGIDTADSPPIEADGNGHGTHVAGTVMSRNYGIAKAARAIAVKVLGASGSGTTAGVIDGVDWTCSDHTTKRNKCVANMSLGGGLSAAMNRAVEAATECGCSMAVASGNDARDACSYSPASAETPVVTVNSMDNTDSPSYFSNHGTCTNIYAPGSAITSTWIGSNSAINTISGTSMASPHVCGVMAKMAGRSAPGSDDPNSIARALVSEATKGVLSPVGAATPNELLFATCAAKNVAVAQE
eukprot:m.256130 g.256130  ORF g.256130 m.256130 type:complete len:432 (-) comp34089_c0_seq1:256-1551(-)